MSWNTQATVAGLRAVTVQRRLCKITEEVPSGKAKNAPCSSLNPKEIANGMYPAEKFLGFCVWITISPTAGRILIPVTEVWRQGANSISRVGMLPTRSRASPHIHSSVPCVAQQLVENCMASPNCSTSAFVVRPSNVAIPS
eukprot:1027510-Rhodomonas_salina.1